MSTNPLHYGEHLEDEAHSERLNDQREERQRVMAIARKADWQAFTLSDEFTTDESRMTAGAVIVDTLSRSIVPVMFNDVSEAMDFLSWRPDEHLYRDTAAMLCHYQAYRMLRYGKG